MPARLPAAPPGPTSNDTAVVLHSLLTTHELALVLVDLVAHVHSRWAQALGMDDDQARDAWRDLLAAIENWRATR